MDKRKAELQDKVKKFGFGVVLIFVENIIRAEARVHVGEIREISRDNGNSSEVRGDLSGVAAIELKEFP